MRKYPLRKKLGGGVIQTRVYWCPPVFMSYLACVQISPLRRVNIIMKKTYEQTPGIPYLNSFSANFPYWSYNYRYSADLYTKYAISLSPKFLLSRNVARLSMTTNLTHGTLSLLNRGTVADEQTIRIKPECKALPVPISNPQPSRAMPLWVPR